MADGFWHIAESAPEKTALFSACGPTLSYGAMAQRVNALSHAFAAQGIGRGGVIASLTHNRLEVMEIYLAAMQSGLYYVPINYHATASDVDYILQNAEASALFYDRANRDRAQAALASDANRAIQGYLIDGDEPDQPSLAFLRAAGKAERPPQRMAGSLMQYTSGTTGRPKGVKRPLPEVDVDAWASGIALQLRWYGMTESSGCHLVTSPMYHSAVLSHAMSALNLGHGIAIMTKWDETEFLSTASALGAGSTHMVATHFHRLLKLPEAQRAQYDLGAMTHLIHGAVPTPIHVKQAMFDWLGPVIYEYYGSSEVGATLVGPREWLERPGTVGRPLEITQLRILDDEGRELGTGERGWVYMKQGNQQFEYHKDAAKTRKANRDGFTCVGDIGYVDEAGYLFLCGRDAEIIISGGVNIYPAACESALLQHPAVADAGVIGTPDSEFGEQVTAVIALSPGHSPSDTLAEALIAHCRERLSSIECPRQVDFRSNLPRDPSGKLLKNELRKPYWEKHGREL